MSGESDTQIGRPGELIHFTCVINVLEDHRRVDGVRRWSIRPFFFFLQRTPATFPNTVCTHSGRYRVTRVIAIIIIICRTHDVPERVLRNQSTDRINIKYIVLGQKRHNHITGSNNIFVHCQIFPKVYFRSCAFKYECRSLDVSLTNDT